MERLQAAIEKARAQRTEPQSPDARKEKPRAAARPPAGAVAEAWDKLAELQVSRLQMHRMRIPAYEGGIESAPYDMLRTRMLLQARKNGWRRIALVSPHSKCGKSTTTVNLAFSLSRQRDLRCMVLDFDLRRAGLTAILGQHSAFCMADVLERKADFADQARRYSSNIAFGFNNGAKIRNPSEILQSPQTAEVLDEISATYAPDIMLFDMPPLMASDDNFAFLQNVDCALILVAAERTTMSQIDVAERNVAELTNVMGIVLNKCRYMTGAHGTEYDYY
ncbi:MAG: CpsD/CapB family tyrosine-protein kinase [Jhaorihella sp.]